jgi:hypothetical protein
VIQTAAALHKHPRFKGRHGGTSCASNAGNQHPSCFPKGVHCSVLTVTSCQGYENPASQMSLAGTSRKVLSGYTGSHHKTVDEAVSSAAMNLRRTNAILPPLCKPFYICVGESNASLGIMRILERGGTKKQVVALHGPAIPISPFDVHVRFASHDWAPRPPRHPGIGCGVDGSRPTLAAAATANDQWIVLFVLLRTCGLFLLTKANS